MKWAAFWNNAEVEVYCFYHLKYRKLVWDSLLVLCFIVPVVWGMGPVAYVTLSMGGTLAVLQLGATLKLVFSERKKKRRQHLMGQRAMKEVKKIINGAD